MHDVLRVDGIQDSTVASLRLSLEASLMVLEREDKEGLKFFFLIGMLPGGAFSEELEAIYGSEWSLKVEALLSMSLLSSRDSVSDLGE